MQITITTKQVLKVLYIITWILFIGLCVEAGSFLFNAIFTVAFNPGGSGYFHLTDLYSHDSGNFLVMLLFMFITGVMKAIIFYLIIRIFRDKKLDMEHPFNRAVCKTLFLISYLSVAIGLFSSWGMKYSEWLNTKGIAMPDLQILRLGGADVWLFMGVVLYIIAQIFKRGIEIQTENELTI